MARKTKRTMGDDDVATLRAELARHAREEWRQRELPTELRGLEYLYGHKQNPLAAWHAYRLCRKYELPLAEWPAWVLAYLDDAADKLIGIEPKATKSIKTKNPRQPFRDVKSVASDAARALGLVRRTQLNLYDQFKRELRDLEMFIDVELYLTEHGGKYGALKPMLERYADERSVEPRTIHDQYRRWLRILRGKQRISVAPDLS